METLLAHIKENNPEATLLDGTFGPISAAPAKVEAPATKPESKLQEPTKEEKTKQEISNADILEYTKK